MSWKHWLRSGVALSVAAVAVGMSAPTPAGVDVGDKVSYSFREPLLNGMGLTKLEDLRGKPVVVEFWGTR